MPLIEQYHKNPKQPGLGTRAASFGGLIFFLRRRGVFWTSRKDGLCCKWCKIVDIKLYIIARHVSLHIADRLCRFFFSFYLFFCLCLLSQLSAKSNVLIVFMLSSGQLLLDVVCLFFLIVVNEPTREKSNAFGEWVLNAQDCHCQMYIAMPVV